MSEQDAPADGIDPDVLAEIERTAADLARLAGAEIQNSLGRTFEIRYKEGGDPAAEYRDPVSEVDRRAEVLIRTRLEELFPTHGILGEEMDEKPGDADAFVWAVDPIDGTTNFINGFPLFAASIGVLHRGRPVAGAVWCAASHALRAGVYHASLGGELRFEGETLLRTANPGVRKRLAGLPDAGAGADGPWDMRKTGSASIECAFVAAGLMQVARFERPNVWDVAGGIVLVQAAGQTVHTAGRDGWKPFTGFGAEHGEEDARTWRRPLILGDERSAWLMIEAVGRAS